MGNIEQFPHSTHHDNGEHEGRKAEPHRFQQVPLGMTSVEVKGKERAAQIAALTTAGDWDGLAGFLMHDRGYTSVMQFRSGRAVATRDGEFYVIDTNGTQLYGPFDKIVRSTTERITFGRAGATFDVDMPVNTTDDKRAAA